MNELIGTNPAVVGTDHSLGAVAQTTRTWLPSIAAALLGIVVIAGVGFAPGVAHDAAHDVRHTMAFPCH